ncbi:DUF3592 domain-containing protein [Balneolaceae bacterium YR4-1]|uniref:DUF3592 domain-containing protein n=1 Tax=Halalkalibaculum roseum TaxID=2709311 RepID=A0A6M1SRM7_9BACT|nr:DUF3592 domain-containing protein [Halalkalibaculum roseum]NGP75402.1 DUF3592 domain-containing protein [Halalkalibaculum roseum]
MDIILLLVGAIFAFAGFAILWNQLYALLYFDRAVGKVIALERRTTPESNSRKKGGPMYYPVVEYIGKGNMLTFTGNTGSNWPAYEIGEEVNVLYSYDTKDAQLKSAVPLFIGLIFGLIGLGLCYYFFITFTFSLFSMAIYAFGGILIVRQVKKGLKKRDINSLDELKESFRNTEMKTKKGTAPEQSVRINNTEELNREVFKKSKGLKYVGPVFTLVGLALVGLSIYLGMKRAEFLETALTASGEVTRLIESRSDDSYVYYPMVEFTVPGSEQAITFRHDSGSNPPSYSVGEVVSVLYDPQNPHNAIIDGGLLNWFATALTSLLGLIFAGVGISSVISWQKYKRITDRY